MYLLMVVFVGALIVKVLGPWLDGRFPADVSPA